MISSIRKAWHFVTLLLKYASLTEYEANGKSCLAIKIQGSTITFSSDGDVLIRAKRNLVYRYQYQFANCSPEFIEQVMSEGTVISMEEFRKTKSAKEAAKCHLEQCA